MRLESLERYSGRMEELFDRNDLTGSTRRIFDANINLVNRIGPRREMVESCQRKMGQGKEQVYLEATKFLLNDWYERWGKNIVSGIDLNEAFVRLVEHELTQVLPLNVIYGSLISFGQEPIRELKVHEGKWKHHFKIPVCLDSFAFLDIDRQRTSFPLVRSQAKPSLSYIYLDEGRKLFQTFGQDPSWLFDAMLSDFAKEYLPDELLAEAKKISYVLFKVVNDESIGCQLIVHIGDNGQRFLVVKVGSSKRDYWYCEKDGVRYITNHFEVLTADFDHELWHVKDAKVYAGTVWCSTLLELRANSGSAVVLERLDDGDGKLKGYGRKRLSGYLGVLTGEKGEMHQDEVYSDWISEQLVLVSVKDRERVLGVLSSAGR